MMHPDRDTAIAHIESMQRARVETNEMIISDIDKTAWNHSREDGEERLERIAQNHLEAAARQENDYE